MAQQLPYDLTNPSDVSRCRTDFQRWLDEDLAVQEKYWQEWNDIDARLNTSYTPVGWSEDYHDNLATKNNPTQNQQVIREFVQVPRTRPNHESKFGDFLTTRRRLNITGRKPSGRNRAKVIHSYVEYVEDSELIPELVYAPAIDNGISKGLHWIKLGYNPRARGLKGRFEPSEVNLRDVMVDCSTRGWYFKSMQRVSQRKKYRVSEARKKFQRYPLFNAQKLGSDREYDDPYENTENTNDDFCTIYEIQFRMTVNTYMILNEDQKGVSEISEEEFIEAQKDPNLEPRVFYDEEEKYYVALYNSTTGPFFLAENPFKMWTLIPVVNINTDQRVYPLGDVQIYRNLQDLLDVLVTVFLDNAKRGNKPIATGKSPEIYSEYKAQIDSALSKGGFAPGVDNLHYPQSINAALTQLVPWVIGWIQDSASRHGASMGELPSRQIAKETVQMLIAKDRQSHGRMDGSLKYALTQFAKLMVSYICAFCDEPDFIDVADTKPNSPSHIPINQVWTEDEYIANLADIYGIPVPSSPQEDEQFNQKLVQLKAQFEQDNDVQPALENGFSIGNRLFTQKSMMEMVQQSGLSQEDFVTKYAPMPATVKTVKVNILRADDPDLNVTYEIDNDYQNDPEFRANRALMLNSRGAMTNLDMMKEMDIPNAEEIDKNAQAQNQVLGIAKQLASNPELMSAVQNVLSQNGGGKQ